MTAEEFVKQQYPRAFVQKYEQGNGVVKKLRTVYYLCWTEIRGERLSEGISKSNAWSNAKKNILA